MSTDLCTISLFHENASKYTEMHQKHITSVQAAIVRMIWKHLLMKFFIKPQNFLFMVGDEDTKAKIDVQKSRRILPVSVVF